MYALFLESKAAEEVRLYAENHDDVVLDELLKLTHLRAGQAHNSSGWGEVKTEPLNAEEQQKFDDWWVTLCLADDSHKQQDIDSLFCWGDTPEGHDFWEGISRRDAGEGW